MSPAKRFGWGLGICVAVWGAQVAFAESDSLGPMPNGDVVSSLRARGPAGLGEAMTIFQGLNRQLEATAEQIAAESKQKPVVNPLDETRQRFARLTALRGEWQAAIDQIGGQRSCSVSQLYWYTDLEQAKAEAERTGRPILHLRMLGKLTDEFSCANSRFFRTSLYSNQEISNYLRDNFVLHWQSVRPVPRVTIDFGDGRKLERTLTGNSAHYILAADGQPLDVLPGLYGPQQFLNWLSDLRTFHESLATIPEANRAPMVAVFHRGRQNALMQRWDSDVERLDDGLKATFASRLGVAAQQPASGRGGRGGGAPGAMKAGAVAMGKYVVEMPVMRFANLGGEQLEKAMDDSLWQALAGLHREEVKLDASSVAVMTREFPTAAQAGRRAGGKARVEDPILRVVRQFENSISLDAVRNEYLLHRRIHELFMSGEPIVSNADSLNEWVYAELFLTPSSDPWLGLAPSDVYTALESNGQVVATTSGTN